MEHLRTTLWGPAEFVGLPSRRLWGEGLLAGLLACAAIVGVGFAGMWFGPPSLANGETGMTVVASLVLYLLVRRAGKILIGLVAALGTCLALAAPQVAAGLVLAERGAVQSVSVTSVERVAARKARYLCGVSGDGGMVPAGTRVWRGCSRSVLPGDALAVVYDPLGRAPTRGVADSGEARSAQLQLAALAAMFIAGCTTTVVRSFRMTSQASDTAVVSGTG